MASTYHRVSHHYSEDGGVLAREGEFPSQKAMVEGAWVIVNLIQIPRSHYFEIDRGHLVKL